MGASVSSKCTSADAEVADDVPEEGVTSEEEEPFQYVADQA